MNTLWSWLGFWYSGTYAKKDLVKTWSVSKACLLLELYTMTDKPIKIPVLKVWTSFCIRSWCVRRRTIRLPINIVCMKFDGLGFCETLHGWNDDNVGDHLLKVKMHTIFQLLRKIFVPTFQQVITIMSLYNVSQNIMAKYPCQHGSTLLCYWFHLLLCDISNY